MLLADVEHLQFPARRNGLEIICLSERYRLSLVAEHCLEVHRKTLQTLFVMHVSRERKYVISEYSTMKQIILFEIYFMHDNNMSFDTCISALLLDELQNIIRKVFCKT